VVTTSVEHNSVMRPLRHLESLGVRVTVVDCAPSGLPDLGAIRQALRGNARLLVTTHASNVTGAVLPIAELAASAREAGVLYLVDAAQTAGAIPIDVERMGVDLLAFTGHKGLLGPTGTGGLYIREGVKVEPLMRGGTGSDSAHETQPEYAPDAYESGTLNVAGLAGLAASVRLLASIGIEAVREHECQLAGLFAAGVAEIPGVVVYGPSDHRLRCGVVSFNVAGAVPSEVGLILDQSFGILCRTGLHCAPAAHRTMGTFPAGAVRFGFGWFNTPAEVDASLLALRRIAGWAAQGQMEMAGGRPQGTQV
jgi:cysteine desulfurase / selenocysteine lyase